jgi:hypothetical protein
MKIDTDINVDGIILDDVKHGITINLEEHLTYPFADELKLNVDDIDIPLDTQVDMCIYRIHRSHTNIPFLEFLLYLDGMSTDKGGHKLTFPYILSKHTKSGLVDQCTVPLSALFGLKERDIDSVVKYNGYIYNKREKQCTLFFNNFYEIEKGIPFLGAKNRWWWTLSSEIFNARVMMNYQISDSVISFFSNHPSIMHLKLHGRVLESPSALYSGKHFNYISYMGAFGIKKSSIRAHFGPYYYSGDFIGTMRYSCYSMGFEPHVLDNGTSLTVNQYGKHSKGGIVRFAVFLGRCRAFFLNSDEDRSELSMYWANTDRFVKAKLALRDINGDWTFAFNSAYVGEYTLKIGDKSKTRIPGWTIKDYDNQIPLSYHDINMDNVPDEYDPEFTDYNIK